MKKYNYPYIASGLGLFLMLVVIKGSEIRGDGSTLIPLLTLLIISEFGFFATAIGVYIGVKHMLSVGMKIIYTVITIFCALLSLRFMFYGIDLWPI